MYLSHSRSIFHNKEVFKPVLLYLLKLFFSFLLNFWVLYVSRTASYETTLIRLSVTKFSQERSLVFFWYCTWSWLTMISGDWRSQIFGETGGPNEQKSVPKLDFCHFLKFGSLVFLEIAYNDSLQQCITSSRGKILKKSFGDQIWAKIRLKTRFSVIFWSLVHYVCLKLNTTVACNNV